MILGIILTIVNIGSFSIGIWSESVVTTVFAITGLVTSVFLILISAYEISETTVRLTELGYDNVQVNINNDRATLDINGKRYVCVLTQDPDGDVRIANKADCTPKVQKNVKSVTPEDFESK